MLYFNLEGSLPVGSPGCVRAQRLAGYKARDQEEAQGLSIPPAPEVFMKIIRFCLFVALKGLPGFGV